MLAFLRPHRTFNDRPSLLQQRTLSGCEPREHGFARCLLLGRRVDRTAIHEPSDRAVVPHEEVGTGVERMQVLVLVTRDVPGGGVTVECPRDLGAYLEGFASLHYAGLVVNRDDHLLLDL